MNEASREERWDSALDMYDSGAPGAFDALCQMREDAPESEQHMWAAADFASAEASLRVRGGDSDDPMTWDAPHTDESRAASDVAYVETVRQLVNPTRSAKVIRSDLKACHREYEKTRDYTPLWIRDKDVMYQHSRSMLRAAIAADMSARITENRRQPHRSHRQSRPRTSARRTRRSGAARALSRLADDPAEPPSGRDAGLALSLAVVGGLDTLPACWRVIA